MINRVLKTIDCIADIPYSIPVITLISGGLTLMLVLRLDHHLKLLPAWF